MYGPAHPSLRTYSRRSTETAVLAQKVQREGPGSLMVLYVRVHGENEENGTAC